jgi:hypothetical protein
MADENGRFKFRKEVGLVEVLVAVGLLGLGGDRVYNGSAGGGSASVAADIGAIKQGQAVQSETNRRIESNIERVSQEVKQQGDTLRSIEAKVNRARL